MFIFLDESGDLGFNWQHKKTSRYFVITLLATSDFPPFKTAVKRTLRNKVNHKKKKRIVSELKGSSTAIEIKKYFYNLVHDNQSWHLHSLILDKHSLSKHIPLTESKHRLYNILSKTVLEGIASIKRADVIQLFVDRCKNTKEINHFDQYIRANLELSASLNASLNIEHLNSQQSAGLQAVDLFCYGIARKYEWGDDSWYQCFSHRIKREVIYRP